ncbi:MAG: c-type cytochrome [Candidatus Sericytochromatia bacterium]
MIKKMLPIIALISIAIPASMYFYNPENSDLKKVEKENTFEGYQGFLSKYPESKNKEIILEKADKIFLSDKNLSVDSGKEIYSQNCSYCHGNLNNEPIPPKKAIPLIQASSKLNNKWITNALSDPENHLNNYLMPMYHLSTEESASIATYILEKSDDSYGQVKNVKIDSKLEAEGKKIYEKNGCNYCHGIDGKNGGGGPNLDSFGNKANPNWTLNPRSYHPNTIMPPNGMNDNETLAVVSWLHSLKSKSLNEVTSKGDSLQGKELIKKYGCASCHNIVGIKSDIKDYPSLFNSKNYKYGSDSISIINSINHGIKNSAMPAWSNTLKVEDIKNITAYIKVSNK